MPAGLGAHGKALWTKLQAGYGVVDPAGLAVIEQAAKAIDRLEECRRAIARDGVTTTDRWGQVKPHPLLASERDARAGVLAAIRQLGAEVPED
jgi:P27 family predicted phage terminase small subunit